MQCLKKEGIRNDDLEVLNWSTYKMGYTMDQLYDVGELVLLCSHNHRIKYSADLEHTRKIKSIIDKKEAQKLRAIASENDLLKRQLQALQNTINSAPHAEIIEENSINSAPHAEIIEENSINIEDNHKNG
jgi:hypothetical protein